MVAENHDCDWHAGDLVKVGDYEVYAGSRILSGEVLSRVDVVVSLNDGSLINYSSLLPSARRIYYPITNHGVTNSKKFERFLRKQLIPELEAGHTLAVHCMMGVSRTSLVLAALITLLEPDVEDPVQAVRQRYCPMAVETSSQIATIFNLKGKAVPEYYL